MTVQRSKRFEEDQPPSIQVIEALAAVTDMSEFELEPLNRTIDPDALNALLTRNRGDVEVSFQYDDYQVRVTPNEVRILDPHTE